MSDGLKGFEQQYDTTMEMKEEATLQDNIGQLTLYTTAHIWKAGSGVTEVESDEWDTFKPVRQQSTKFISLHVCLDLQEFDSGNTYMYDKFVTVNGYSSWIDVNGDGQKEKFESDWFTTWEPSLKEILGKQYQSTPQALNLIQGKYVRIRNVKQQPVKKNPVPADNHTTPKLAEIYESREVAYAAYQQLRGNVTVTTKEYDTDVIKTVRMLANNKTATNASIAVAIGGGLSESDVKTIRLGV